TPVVLMLRLYDPSQLAPDGALTPLLAERRSPPLGAGAVRGDIDGSLEPEQEKTIVLDRRRSGERLSLEQEFEKPRGFKA
ncbi:MAG: hypothetical protein PWR25_1149, partial [Euryarchaeota archaeon]|nr:hypothetical protein [Euryarchaeota archaeon]